MSNKASPIELGQLASSQQAITLLAQFDRQLDDIQQQLNQGCQLQQLIRLLIAAEDVYHQLYGAQQCHQLDRFARTYPVRSNPWRTYGRLRQKAFDLTDQLRQYILDVAFQETDSPPHRQALNDFRFRFDQICGQLDPQSIVGAILAQDGLAKLASQIEQYHQHHTDHQSPVFSHLHCLLTQVERLNQRLRFLVQQKPQP